jgi:hypothetical protein
MHVQSIRLAITMDLKRYILCALLIVLVDAVFLWPFSYECGYGHSDLNAMEMAVYSADGTLPTWAFRSDISSGWYFLAKAVKDAFHLTAQEFAGVTNRIAAVVSTCGLLLMFAALACFIPPNAAFITVILWRFVPEIWEVNTYCHPWTVGFAVLNLGICLGMHNPGRKEQESGQCSILFQRLSPPDGRASLSETMLRLAVMWLSHILSVLSFLLALTIRADLVFFFPIALGLVYVYKNERFHEWIALFAVTSAIYFAEWLVFADHSHVSLMMSFLGHFPGPAQLLANGALAAHGGGLAFFVCFACILVKCVKNDHRRVRSMLLWGGALLPTIVFWLPIGLPARHFAPFYMVQCITLGIALSSAGKRSSRKILVPLAGVVILIAANSALAESIFRTIIAKRPPNLIQIGEERRTIESVPLGDFVLNHLAQERINALFEQRTMDVLALSEQSAEGMLVACYPSHRINTLASERYGPPHIVALEGKQIWEYRAKSRPLWTVSLYDGVTLGWWESLEKLALSEHKRLILFGTRIPRRLINVSELER